MRLKIDIEVHGLDGNVFMADCSRLFHASLKSDIARLWQRAEQSAPDIEVGRMILDLGDLREASWQKDLREKLLLKLPVELHSLARLGPAVVRSPARARRSEERGRAGKPATQAEVAVQEIQGAGLVLLWPLLPRLLADLGCTQEGRFRSEADRHKAVRCLDLLIPRGTAQGWQAEAASRPTLSRLLCGLTLDVPPRVMTEVEDGGVQEEANLHAHLSDWRMRLPTRLPGLGRCGATDIAAFFLSRPGEVRTRNGVTAIYVEPDVSDILLRAIPWPMDQVVLPWLDAPLRVVWRKADAF